MRRIRPLSIALALVWACSLPSPAVAQDYAENWHSVASQIGGSGMSMAGRYVRLLPSRAWHPKATPPTWLAFSREGDERILRGSIPVLREQSAGVVEHLTKRLPKGCKVAVRDSHGADSRRVHVRFMANEMGEEGAGLLREVMEQIEPGALARIDTTGVVVKESFDCEEFLFVRTDAGVSIDVGKLPQAIARVGTRVRLVAARHYSRRHGFSHMGSVGHWITRAKLGSVTEIPALPAAKQSGGRARWLKACRKRARSLVESGLTDDSRDPSPLATGFLAFTDPGFRICPRCHDALEKGLLFSNASHDRVDASLGCCVREHLFYLGRDDVDHGPFRSSAPAKEIR